MSYRCFSLGIFTPASAKKNSILLLLLVLLTANDKTILPTGGPRPLADAFTTVVGNRQTAGASRHSRGQQRIQSRFSLRTSCFSRGGGGGDVDSRLRHLPTCRRRWISSLLQHQPDRLQAAGVASAAYSVGPRSTATTRRKASMSSSESNNVVRPGCIVAFDPETKGGGGGPVLGLILGTVGKKKGTFNTRPAAAAAAGSTSTVAVALRQVKYLLPGGNEYQESDLMYFDAMKPADSSLLEDAWEMLLEEALEAGAAAETGTAENGGGAPAAGTSEPRSLAELLFGSADPTPQECYQAFRLLEGAEGTLRFKRQRDGHYEARSREAVNLALRKLEAEQEVEAKKGELAAKLQEGIRKGGGQFSEPLVKEDYPPEEQEVLRALEFMASQMVVKQAAIASKTSEEILGSDLLGRMGRPASPATAFNLCVQLGLMRQHENLFAREAGIHREFPDAAIAEVRKILDGDPPPDPDASIRTDLTHLKVYAVDSEDTMEVDDGISIERLPQGAGERIWIHIADVSRWVSERSAMYHEARRRRTTTYLPEGSVPMFPPEVAHGLLSLRAGKTCFALSMGITLGSKGEIMDAWLTPSLIKVTYRLTYDDVEEMLAMGLAGASEEWELGRIAELSELRHKYRCDNGSVDQFEKGLDSMVKAIENPTAPGGYDVMVLPEDPSSKSIRMVTEIMILSGEAMGRLASVEGIPLPFRNQKPPVDGFDHEFLDSLPAKYCRAQGAYRFMSAASTAPTPLQHWGLGLESYVQWSSPIRRFMDLITHYQIKKWLHKEALLAGSDIMGEVLSGEGVMTTANRVMRQSSKYWVSEFLSRLAGREMEAYVVSYRDTREKGGKVIYNLLLLGLGVTLPAFEMGLSMELGDTVVVKIVSASARHMNTRISWRRMTPAEKLAVESRLINEQALAISPDGGGVAGAVASNSGGSVATTTAKAATGAIGVGAAEAP